MPLLISMAFVFEEGKMEGRQGNFSLEISFHITSFQNWPVPVLIIALPLVPVNAMFS